MNSANHNFAYFFNNNARNDDKNYLPFGVNYDSIAQRILAIFDPRYPFQTYSIDDGRKT